MGWLRCWWLFAIGVSFVWANEVDIQDRLEDLLSGQYNSEFCSRIKCESSMKDCSGMDRGIKQVGSAFQCCDVCVDYINEHEDCDEHNPEVVCRPGLQCKDGKCQRKDNIVNCFDHVEKRKLMMEDESYSKNLWIPTCDKEGHFIAVQCKKNKCVCVDKNGNRIFGQAERHIKETKNMTCACSQELEDRKKTCPLTWMIKPQEHCTQSGDYDTLQCVGEVCYCSDPGTGQPIGRMTTLPFLTLLPCYDPKIHEEKYLRQCEKQLIQARSLTYEFFKKGIVIEGLEKVICDLDGTFSAKQCFSEKCICVDRSGKQWKSYAADKASITASNMNCRCARDEQDNEENFARYESLSCLSNGNFVPWQCHDEKCYCVDEDGDVISSELEKLSNDDMTMMCEDMNHQLYPTM